MQSFKQRANQFQPAVPGEDTVLLDGQHRPPLRQRITGYFVNSGIPFPVWIIYVIAFFNWCSQQLGNPIVLIYLRKKGWASSTDVSFYSYSYFAGLTLRTVLSPFITHLQERTSSKFVMNLLTIVSFVGFVVVALSESKAVFLIGYMATFSQTTLRSVRMSFIAKSTSTLVRGKAMSLHTLVSPLGSLLGPIIALSLSPISENASIRITESFELPLGRNEATFWMASVICLIQVFFISVVFSEIEADRGPQRVAERPGTWSGQVAAQSISLGKIIIDTNAWVRNVFWVLSISVFLVNFGSSFLDIAFQPILVDKFHVTHAEISSYYIVVMALGIIPPAVQVRLSSKVDDRTMMFLGLFIKLVGLFMFTFPPLSNSRAFIVAAYAINSKAVAFYFTAVVVIFSKLLSARAQGFRFGLFITIAMSGSAAATIVGGHFILDLYGTYWIMLFILPVLVVFLITLFVRPIWKLYDTNRDIVKKINSAERPMREPVDVPSSLQVAYDCSASWSPEEPADGNSTDADSI